MRHITYTTCFDEVLTAVVPNLPDQSSLAYTVPRPPRSAEAGGDYLCGFNELRRLLAFLCSDARPSGSRPGEFRASDDPGSDHGGGSRRPADRGACVLDQHGSCALASAGEMSCVYPLSRPWPRKRSKLSLPSGIVRSRPERTAFAQGLPTAAARSLDRLPRGLLLPRFRPCLPAAVANPLRDERAGRARAGYPRTLPTPGVGHRRAQALGEEKSKGVRVEPTSP